MNIDKEVVAAIEKNLPSAVGDVLRKRLEQADETDKKLTASNEIAQKYLAQNTENAQKLSAANDIIAGMKLLVERKDALDERERNMEVAMLKTQLAAEQRVSTGYREFLGILVKNPVFKETVYSNETKSYPQSGGYMASATDSKTVTSTKDVE